MYQYIWDEETGGLLLTTEISKFSKEPRPVYYRELDLLGFDQYWDYPKDDSAPIMWAEANNYIYRGRKIASLKGGALHTAPELIIYEENPEPSGGMLRFVDIEKMLNKNSTLMETLVQETIQKVYNTYRKYKSKVDLFYVAFSGGKDSVVALDIVQKALPHDDFMVLFGDTRMEFSHTYDVISKVEKWCRDNGIRFETARSHFSPDYTWTTIGPPAQKMRWCCSVHKTTPQILLLRQIMNNPHFRGMAMMGVRSDESVTRSRYEEINFGTKHQGQYDYYPIFEWGSAELFIYIYQEHLVLNETYKLGNSRAGCLVCPMEAVKNSWFKNQCYAGSCDDCQTTSFYHNLIIDQTFARELPEDKLKEFMEIGVWKSRHNGAKLASPRHLYHEEKKKNELIITIVNDSEEWKEWFKTLGDITYLPNNTIEVFCNQILYRIEYTKDISGQHFRMTDLKNTQKEIYFISWLKVVLRKSAYCIRCQICEANCPHGYIHMTDDAFFIEDKCVKCRKCYEVNTGCVVAASHRMPKEVNQMNGSIDQYKNMGVRYQWVVDYLEKKNDFWDNNNLGSMMITALKTFLRHSDIADKGKKYSITTFGEKISEIGVDTDIAWALILCNVVYTEQFNWWVMNIDLHRTYSKAELTEMLKETALTSNGIKNVLDGFKNIFYTNDILSQQIKFGQVNVEEKGRNIYLVDVCRSSWDKADPRVILYALYKFAEHCGDYYQFTLTTLMDDSIERDGISPTRIFGLDRDTMEPMLNGLSSNYPDFISASFSLGLDTINLREDKTSQDVLALF